MSLDPRAARVVFRERSGAEVLDLALRFVVAHAGLYGRLAAVVLVPCLALTALAVKVVSWPWGWLVAACMASVASLPFTVLASRLAFADTSLREVLAASARGAATALALRIVTVVLVVVGGSCFVLPGLWVYLVLWFSSEVVLLEGAGPGDSLFRAVRVARTSFGETLVSAFLLLSLLAGAIVLGDVAGRTILGDLLEIRPPRSLFDEGGSFLALLGLFAAVPYVATARFFAYLDARTRAEGWDVQTAFAALVAREGDVQAGGA